MMLMMMLMIKLICACVLRREAGSSKVLFEHMKVKLKPEVEFATYMFTVEKKNAYVLFVAETENVSTFPGFLTLFAFGRSTDRFWSSNSILPNISISYLLSQELNTLKISKRFVFVYYQCKDRT